MRPVDIGIGHNNDAFVAERILTVMRTRARAERQDDIGELLVAAHLVGRRARYVQDLTAQRQDRLGFAVARLLGGAAGAVAFDKKDLGARRTITSAVGKLAGQAQLAGRRLA